MLEIITNAQLPIVAVLLAALLFHRLVIRNLGFTPPSHRASPDLGTPARLASIVASILPRRADGMMASLAATWMTKGTEDVDRKLKALVPGPSQPRAPEPVAAVAEDPAPNESDVMGLILRGKQSARAGDRGAAQRTFLRALQLDPTNEEAWLWMAGLAHDPQESLAYLEFVLDRNPHNLQARQGFEQLQRQVAAG